MTKYKMFKAKYGTRYMKDGKLVSEDSLPREVVERLNISPELDIPDRICIFCGKQSKYYRTVNGQTVYLCNKHYYSETIGKVAEVINFRKKEKANG